MRRTLRKMSLGVSINHSERQTEIARSTGEELKTDETFISPSLPPKYSPHSSGEMSEIARRPRPDHTTAVNASSAIKTSAALSTSPSALQLTINVTNFPGSVGADYQSSADRSGFPLSRIPAAHQHWTSSWSYECNVDHGRCENDAESTTILDSLDPRPHGPRWSQIDLEMRRSVGILDQSNAQSLEYSLSSQLQVKCTSKTLYSRDVPIDFRHEVSKSHNISGVAPTQNPQPGGGYQNGYGNATVQCPQPAWSHQFVYRYSPVQYH